MSGLQSLLHLVPDALHILGADRHANQAVGDSLPAAFCGAGIAVRSRGGMADRGRAMAQRRTERNAGRLAHEAIDGVTASLEFEAHHVAEAATQNLRCEM